MGSLSIWHWLIVAIIVLLLFGKGRMSDFMGDLAKGIKSFKKGMAEDDTTPAPAQQVAAPPPVTPAATPAVTPQDVPRA
ncbi:twin-arginine translocase TatA/TatE family subunit [Sandaracinobacteroides saxicola]|uniref:Sec-independent protein translocase protein TatA n=1 Tax=Sandaracinobacteroides saxicola TaxID=2759707 RepID=A0A7G5IHY2_9SPHN|nr:twin-arginine translocase TatA/TatE family subunit [Sandaracinobacteroides saxicola]QMW22974.1 twin-arginine translocase TatA/TatE family subunit [Sandaracinobacteroides saxicola]